MWLQKFDVIALSIMSEKAIVCDINTIELVSEYSCRVSDALVASCATAH